MCFGFFFLYAVVLSGVQAFAPEAARQLHDVPTRLAALCLTFYMVASACGMVLGGFLASDPSRCEKIIAVGFGIAAMIALTKSATLSHSGPSPVHCVSSPSAVSVADSPTEIHRAR